MLNSDWRLLTAHGPAGILAGHGAADESTGLPLRISLDDLTANLGLRYREHGSGIDAIGRSLGLWFSVEMN